MSFVFPPPKVATAGNSKHAIPPTAHHASPKKLKHLNAAKSTEYYVSNVSIRLPASVKENNIRDKIATLFATMQRIDSSLALLPMKKNNNSGNKAFAITVACQAIHELNVNLGGIHHAPCAEIPVMIQGGVGSRQPKTIKCYFKPGAIQETGRPL